MSLQLPDPSAGGGEPLKIWNCVNCRRRKVRCDRRHPCAPCTKHKIDCVFPVSGRVPSRSRIGDRAAQKQIQLVGRLRRLEAMVGGLSSQVENAARLSQSEEFVQDSTKTTSGISSENGSGLVEGIPESREVPENFGVLEVASNGDLVVGEGFWTVFCKEVEDIFEAVQGHTVMKFDDGSSSSTSDASPHTGYYNFLLRSTSTAGQKSEIYPLPSQMLFLWQIYMDNVDPFIKVLHVPTMAKVIREIKNSYESLGPSMQALVLAISLAAIMSLDEEEVKSNFHDDKNQLIARYRLGTEQALEQADFLNRPDMALLQALTIYLSVLQHTGKMTPAWVLAGVLVRVAISMNLQVDGSKNANISPFEGEMRRRLWWQICLIDSKSGNLQASAYKLSEDMFDTEMPANTNDANIDPHMSQTPPVTDGGWTDTSVFLLRCEIWTLSRRLRSIGPATADINKKRELVKRSQTKIEATYLKHLDPSQPIHGFIATNVRLFFTKVNLVLPPKLQHHNTMRPTNPTPLPSLFSSCLAVIEYTYSLQNESGWAGWRWQIQGRQPPWNALQFVLGQMIIRNWEPLYDRALASAAQTLDSLPKETHSDLRYQELSALLSTVQLRANEYHQQSFRPFETVNADLVPPAQPNLSMSFAQTSIGEDSSSAGVPHAPFFDMLDSSGAEMDWQAWQEIAGDLELWDMGSF